MNEEQLTEAIQDYVREALGITLTKPDVRTRALRLLYEARDPLVLQVLAEAAEAHQERRN